jgi:hypothetical protein
VDRSQPGVSHHGRHDRYGRTRFYMPGCKRMPEIV